MAAPPSTAQVWGGAAPSSGAAKTGALWGGGATTAASAGQQKAKHGIVGFFENLGTDVRNAAVGLPMGIVQTVEHPIRVAKATAKQEWHSWSPLFTGHAGEWAHNFVQHPLAPILDIAAVATLGAGAAGTTALKLSEAGMAGARVAKVAQLASRTELKVAGETAADPAMYRALSRRTGARVRQNLVHEITGRVHPFKSQANLYSDLAKRESMRTRIGINARIDALGKAYKDLSNPTQQRNVFANMYWSIRNGPARSVKVANLVDGKAPKGWAFVQELKHGGPDLFNHAANPTKGGGGDFINELHHIDQRFTASHVSQAALQKGGKEALIVPDRALKAYGTEAKNSATFLRKAYDNPTKVWRAAVLNLRPGFVTNNSVGNAFMMLVNHGDMTGLKAFAHTVKAVRGPKAVERMDRNLSKDWQVHHFADETLAGRGTFAYDNISRGFQARGKHSLLKRASQGVQPLNQRIETMYRKSLITSEMMRDPAVKALQKQGHSFDQAASRALSGEGGAVVRARVLSHAHDTLGDYGTMGASKVDKAIRDVIPFWAWDKTIARHTRKLVSEQPLKAAAMANIGTQGVQGTENKLGAIPDFMKGSVPLPFSFGPMQAGRKSIMTTQGINPYSTIPDLAGTVSSVLGQGGQPALDQSAGALLGPIPTVALEAIKGTRSSGAAIPDKGWGPIGNAVRDTVVNLPPSQLIAAATNHLPSSTTVNKRTGAQGQTLYQKDWESVVSSWLGLPTRKESPASAQKLFDAQGQAKKKKKLPPTPTWGAP